MREVLTSFGLIQPLAFTTLSFIFFHNTVCISFLIRMDMGSLDILWLRHVLQVLLLKNRLCWFRLLLLHVHVRPTVLLLHVREVLQYLPEYLLSCHQTCHNRSSYILPMGLSDHKPEEKYPDVTVPYHRYDPSIYGQ